MNIYLRDKKCIAMFKQKADSSFWDRHWQIDDLSNHVTSCKDNSFIIKPLRKYLPDERGIILEGGCGRAQNVFCMRYNGYNAIGVDFAVSTIEAINEAVPELDVRVCDVRCLPFKDGEIAGYWSLGVIEHFWDGYEDILDEMARVIRANSGFLFLTFPYMSPLRKLKVILRLYKSDRGSANIDSFYQYYLEHRKVINDLEKRGFVIRERIPFDGIKGFKDEVKLFRSFLQSVYDGKRLNSRIGRRVKQLMNRTLEMLSSHCILLIAEKRYARIPVADGEIVDKCPIQEPVF